MYPEYYVLQRIFRVTCWKKQEKVEEGLRVVRKVTLQNRRIKKVTFPRCYLLVVCSLPFTSYGTKMRSDIQSIGFCRLVSAVLLCCVFLHASPTLVTPYQSWLFLRAPPSSTKLGIWMALAGSGLSLQIDSFCHSSQTLLLHLSPRQHLHSVPPFDTYGYS